MPAHDGWSPKTSQTKEQGEIPIRRTSGANSTSLRVVIFDVGGVLLDWNPRHLYRQLFTHEADMEEFLANVCSPTWNALQDAGRPFAAAVAELSSRHPALANLIAAYDHRWEEMVAGIHAETVEILHSLKERGTPLYALTNFSKEKFDLVLRRYPFFQAFDGIVVSGELGFIKPDSRIYHYLVRRYRLRAEECLFVDDAVANIEGARRTGMQAVHFRTPQDLRDKLAVLGLLSHRQMSKPPM